MNKFICSILVGVFFAINSIAQNKMVLLDSLSGTPVAYASIKVNNTGVYSDENGSFVINDVFKKVLIHHINYYEKEVNLKDLSDTIYLKPKINELKEVLIQKRVTKEIIKFHKRPSSFNSFILTPKTEIITLIRPDKRIENYFLDKVSFSFQKLKHSKNKEILEKHFSTIRINIYSIAKNLPDKLLFSSQPLKIKASSKDIVSVDLGGEYFQIENNGLAFSIEYIGNINEQGFFYNNKELYLRPSIVKNKSKYFNASTYIQYPLNTSKKIESINTVINKHLPPGMKEIDRDLNISLELSK